MDTIVEVKDLRFAYHEGMDVLKNLSFSVEKGESVGLIGANGVGKSTFLKLLVGLAAGYDGQININQIAVEKKNLAQIRQMVGYVFQDSESQLFLSTVYDDVAFGPKNYGMGAQEVETATKRALELVRIYDLKDKPIYRLSGGEKKLASIATVLSMAPELLLFDEPSTALDPQNRRNLIHILNELPGAKIIASHDLDFIYDICERTILLNHGQVVYDGPTKDVLCNQKLLVENGLELPLSFSRV